MEQQIFIVKLLVLEFKVKMQISKIYIRSLIGIITAGVVTVLVGVSLPVETMAAFYVAIASYVYLDKDVSGEIPK